jgi:hypothetical protein
MKDFWAAKAKKLEKLKPSPIEYTPYQQPFYVQPTLTPYYGTGDLIWTSSSSNTGSYLASTLTTNTKG